MNYQALKWMLESLVKTYKCPSCDADIWENNVDIVWAAWNTVNIDIECIKCQKHSMIKAEITQIDLSRIPLIKENIEKLKNNLSKMSGASENSKRIVDTEIVKLNKDLKAKNLNISDLLSE